MGYTYVMSDIHGMADLLKRMLEKIRFSDSDSLYILGDMIDRGPDPAGILDLVRASENITALMGNHEDAFVQWYEGVRAGNIYSYFYNTYDILDSREDTREKMAEYVQWMKKLPYFRKLKINGDGYLLAHASAAGIFSLRGRKELCLWDGAFLGKQEGVPGWTSIVGHVPTFLLRGYTGEPACIYRSPNGRVIDVDCGAVFAEHGGRLGCLCLETGEEFYVREERL